MGSTKIDNIKALIGEFGCGRAFELMGRSGLEGEKLKDEEVKRIDEPYEP